MEPLIGYAALTAIFSAGAAWGAVKTALNGTKTRIDETHRKLENHIKDEFELDRLMHERVSSVETKVDILIARVK